MPPYAEVAQLDVVGLGDEDVGWLNVSCAPTGRCLYHPTHRRPEVPWHTPEAGTRTMYVQ